MENVEVSSGECPSGDTMTEPEFGEGESQMEHSTAKSKKDIKGKKPKTERSSGPVKRKKTSKCWMHFTEIPNATYASCNYCGSKIGCDPHKGTGALLNHHKRCKKAPENVDLKQKKLELEVQTYVGDDGVVSSTGVPSLWQFDQDGCRKELARMIIVDELPFAFVEKEGFRRFCNKLNPAFLVPSRTTITRDCYTFFIEEKKSFKLLLNKLSSRVSLTTDAWTSGQNLSYMCLTVHFIDDDWVLHKRILNFCPFAGHSGQLIGMAVEKCLLDWNIKNVMTVTVDNASSNDGAIDYLKRRFIHWECSVLEGNYVHMRCVAHILNLVVRDGLSDLDPAIAKIRGLVKYVRSSPARLERFKACVREEKIESKSLVCLDVDTRWNSTYLMLESVVKFKKTFDNLLLKDHACYKEMTKKGGVGVARDEDWKRVSSFLPILKVFYDGTITLSGSRYVTCNVCVEHMFAIGFSITNLCNNEDESIRQMARQMKLKYDKYWGDVNNINHLLFIAVLLDPRHKMQVVEWLITKCYEGTKATILSNCVKLLASELFTHYESLMPKARKKGSSSSSTPSNTTMGSDESRKGTVMDFTELFTSTFQSEMGHADLSLKSELEKYLEEAPEERSLKFDVLNWWRDNQRRYPILSKMARDVLAIPVTTVASESAFSTGGRILDSFRTSLTPRMVEALICTQDWQRRTNSSVVIEENLLALEEIEEGMKELSIEQPQFMIDEVFDY